jgi:hypothetical protein
LREQQNNGIEIVPVVLAASFEGSLRLLKQADSFAVTVRRMIENLPIDN